MTDGSCPAFPPCLLPPGGRLLALNRLAESLAGGRGFVALRCTGAGPATYNSVQASAVRPDAGTMIVENTFPQCSAADRHMRARAGSGPSVAEVRMVHSTNQVR